MKERKDPLTGEMFVPKRSNQKFASSENQIKYNNDKAKALREEKSEVNKILDKNLIAYKKALKSSDTIIKSGDFLEGAELNLKIFTHIREDEGKVFFMTYDYGYAKLKDEKYFLKNFKKK